MSIRIPSTNEKLELSRATHSWVNKRLFQHIQARKDALKLLTKKKKTEEDIQNAIKILEGTERA